MAAYEVAMVVVGVAVLGAIVLPRVLDQRPLSFPIIFVVFGIALFAIVPGTPTIDPIADSTVTERLTELVIIVSLMAAGLKIDRSFTLRRWASTWRLLAVTFSLTVLVLVLLGWTFLGLSAATAVLLAAVLAPTDPVLASEIGTGPPLADLHEETQAEEWGTVRFALTSEAGFNDGLAFPVTNLAIAMAAASTLDGTDWLLEWLAYDVAYKVAVGLLVGYVAGRVMAALVFGPPATSRLAEVMAGGEALAATLISYGVTELASGYGFIAVFVAAVTLRHYEWHHEYYRELHDFGVVVERLLVTSVLVLFGGAIADGLLADLTLEGVLFGLAFLLVIRPVSGIVGLLGSPMPWFERFVVSSFGIRGIGSFYYLSFALAHASFEEYELLVAAEELWAITGFVVLTSIVFHGIAASPVMTRLDV